MKKKYLNIIVLLVFILSSVATLFSLVQYFSLENELQSYTYRAPISNFISISHFTKGNKSFLSVYVEKMGKSLNKLDSLILETAEEIYIPPPNPEKSGKTVEATLTNNEIKEIERLKGIKAVYCFNIVRDEQFNWYVRVRDKEMKASPVPAGFLYALHPSLAYGRYFDRSDGQNVCILSYSMSKALFNTINSVGRTITVYESGKQVKYKVVGILSSENEDPKYVDALPFIPMYGFLIPYNPKIMDTRFSNSPNLSFFNNLIIIPQRGKYNYLVKKIKGILGEDYPDLGTSLPNLIKFTLGGQIRYNRIKTLTLVSIFTIITALFTLIKFLFLELALKKKEIGIKRAIGKTIRCITLDKILDVFKYYIIAFAIAVITIKVSLPYLGKYTKLGYIVPSMFAPTFSQPVSLKLSIASISISFVILFAFVVIAISFSVSKVLKNPPGVLMKDNKTEHKSNSRFTLVIIFILCTTTLITSLSIINIQRNQITALYNEITPDIIRLSPFPPLSKYIPYARHMNITYDDYILLKKKLKGKAIVGYRCDLPSNTGKFGSRSFIRLLESTEQYPMLYSFEVVKGRFIKDSDFNKFVCAAGETLAEENKLKIGDIYMGRTVVGIVKGNNFIVNHTVYIPNDEGSMANEIVKTPEGKDGGKGLILLKPVSGYSDNDVIGIAKETLVRQHPNKDIPGIVDLKEKIQSIYQARIGTFIILSIFIFLALLASFLSLSALLFIEVIRRTREIGIKKAIGATRREIIKEFTLNGLKTTIIALVIGIPIGILIALFTEKLKQWNYYIPINILILVITISIILGFIFSFLPALFASYVKPVDAIKSE